MLSSSVFHKVQKEKASMKKTLKHSGKEVDESLVGISFLIHLRMPPRLTMFFIPEQEHFM